MFGKKVVGNNGTVLCLPIPNYRWQSNFYWDDVYAREAIGISKVKYITSWQRYKLTKIFVDDENYEKIFDIINEYWEPLEIKTEFSKCLKELDRNSLKQVSRLTGLTVNKIFKV